VTFPQPSHEFVVPAEAAGTRLDIFLAQQGLPYSRSQLGRRIDEGEVWLDGNPSKPGQRIRPGQRVVFVPPPPIPSRDEPEDIPLHVLYEDRHLIVLNKPAGMVVHPAPGHQTGTLVNALLHHCGSLPAPPPRPPTLLDSLRFARLPPGEADEEEDEEQDDGPAPAVLSIGGQRRPGIVHRLDQGTSGVLVCAKDEQTLVGLQVQFQDHSIARRYVALVEGVLPERGTLSTRYGRHPRDRKKFTGRGGSKKAVTHYAVIERLPGATLVEVQLETGRTHQIRVHLSEAGHPVLGDTLYGKPARHRPVQQVSAALGHQALHARLLGFVHPITGQSLLLTAPPPEDFLRALATLRVPAADEPPAPPLPWEISP
jgi:23S rRNA pseudouridine1911/1915/1917 synthase